MRKSSGGKSEETPLRRIRLKTGLVFAVLLALFAAILGRLFQVHVLWHDKLTLVSERQYYKNIQTKPYRGTIYDRAGREMAVSVQSDSVYANPSEIEEPAKSAEKIVGVLKINKKRLTRKLDNKRKFVWIDRQIDPDAAEKLKEMDIDGLHFIRENRRFYPSRELAARTIGFVGIDNQGLAGLEYHFEDRISAKSVKLVVERDAFGRSTNRGEEIAGKGVNIVLSLDKVIQYYAEKELKDQVEATGAKGGVVIVMDPRNGDILAMADQPQFNPNMYGQYNNSHWVNKAVSHTFEPGSTFKILVAAAALDEGLFTVDEEIDCEQGAYETADIVIHEAGRKKYDFLTFGDVLAYSSNIGAVKIGERLEKDRFYEYMKKFGIGLKTGVELPGESSGIFRSPSKWSGTSLAAMSFGQEVSVTPLQLIRAISAVANGGFLITPRIVSAIETEEGVKKELPEMVEGRVISRETSEAITELLVNVVENGTGKRAAMKGFAVAGKTGTSQKAMPGKRGYARDKYISSFVGYLPAHNPRLAVLIMIDEPQTSIFGGQVAAPVFKRIAERTMRYLEIPSEEDSILEAIAI